MRAWENALALNKATTMASRNGIWSPVLKPVSLVCPDAALKRRSALRRLIQLGSCRNLELYSAVVIFLHRRGKIKIRYLHFDGAAIIQFVQRSAHDRVIRDFHLMAIFEDEYGVGLIRDGLGRRLRLRLLPASGIQLCSVVIVQNLAVIFFASGLFAHDLGFICCRIVRRVVIVVSQIVGIGVHITAVEGAVNSVPAAVLEAEGPLMYSKVSLEAAGSYIARSASKCDAGSETLRRDARRHAMKSGMATESERSDTGGNAARSNTGTMECMCLGRSATG